MITQRKTIYTFICTLLLGFTSSLYAQHISPLEGRWDLEMDFLRPGSDRVYIGVWLVLGRLPAKSCEHLSPQQSTLITSARNPTRSLLESYLNYARILLESYWNI